MEPTPVEENRDKNHEFHPMETPLLFLFLCFFLFSVCAFVPFYMLTHLYWLCVLSKLFSCSRATLLDDLSEFLNYFDKAWPF